MSVKAQDNILDTIPKIDGVYQYQAIVNLDSTYKKGTLYNNSKIYFVDNFKSANDVVQYQDANDGKVIGKGLFKLEDVKNSFLGWNQIYWDVYYTTEITCKDGKYRYRLYDIKIRESGQANNGRVYVGDIYIENLPIWLNGKNKCRKNMIKLNNEMVMTFNETVKTIKDYMSKKNAKTKDDF